MISDNKMRVVYKDLEQSMSVLVRSRDDAFQIIWLDIAEMVKVSGVIQKRDFYCSLMNCLTGAEQCGDDIYKKGEKNMTIRH